MAIMKPRDIRDLDNTEIAARLEELRLVMAKERGQIKIGGTPKNPGGIKETRKLVARLLTEITKRKKRGGV